MHIAGIRRNVGLQGFLAVVALWLGIGASSAAKAQDIEPRAYSNAPVGVNFLITGYAYTEGAVPFDASLPVENAQLKTSSLVLAYARVLDLWGKSGKFDAIVPYTSLSGTAELAGQPVEREANGLADPRFRLSVNLYGAPALTLQEFKELRAGPDRRREPAGVGALGPVRLQPGGQHRHQPLVVQAGGRDFPSRSVRGPWSSRPQEPSSRTTRTSSAAVPGRRIPSTRCRGMSIYGSRSGIWGSLDATYFTGGRTTVNGVTKDDLQQNWRLGGTLAFPVDVRNSVKLYGSSGVSARTGNNYDLIGIAWQYRWGAGL
jgi:hypothetical protein